MKKFNKEDGVWRTIGGRRVFIRTGASLSQAMQESGKFNRKKMTRKEKEAEYELYKKARQDENSIDPMTENSTDWEALDKKYRDRYEDEFNPKINVKNDKGQWETKRRSEVRAEADRKFNENQEKIKGMTDSLGITDKREENEAKSMLMNKYNMSETEADRQIGIMKDTKARWEEDNLKRMRHDVRNNVYVHDDGYAEDVPKSLKQLQHERRKEQSKIDRNEFANNLERTEIQKRIDEYDKAILEENSKNKSNDNFLKKAKNLNDWQSGKISEEEYFNRNARIEGLDPEKEKARVSQNMDRLGVEKPSWLEKSNKKTSYWDNIKAGTVDTAGKSNRKEVSNNIQAHIKDYYDSAEDFVNQMEAMKDPSHPTAWSWGQELARGGSYLIYNSDMDEFLGGLNINPKGKKFNDEQVFNNYTALIGRESAKMYDNIRKDAVKTLSERYSGTIDYLKETENMSTSEILELLKKMGR